MACPLGCPLRSPVFRFGGHPFPMPSPEHASQRSPRRAAVAVAAFAALLALLVAMQAAGPATGQTKSEALENVRDRQDDLVAELAASEGAVQELMGQVNELREAEAAANEDLAAKEAELDEATAELESGREELQQLRKEYEAASKELEGMLVSMYKSPVPDLGTVLLDSSDIEDFEARSEYFDRLQGYQASVIDRARTLKVEMDATVERLADTQTSLEDARDEIAARRDEIAGQRSALESRQAELRAVRQARQDALAQLGDREGNLEDAIADQAAEAAEAAGGPAPAAPAPAPVPGQTAQLGADGQAIPPAGAPAEVVAVIEAANRIEDLPYVWGGGHGSFEDSGYDCSGAVSYALHGGGLLDAPLDSTGLMSWGEAGPGEWITVYANPGHTYAIIAGLRWDTSGTGGSGPGWSTSLEGYLGAGSYAARHPSGL
jgi:peptidoglycan hydrolase CwlO-like protein